MFSLCSSELIAKAKLNGPSNQHLKTLRSFDLSFFRFFLHSKKQRFCFLFFPRILFQFDGFPRRRRCRCLHFRQRCWLCVQMQKNVIAFCNSCLLQFASSKFNLFVCSAWKLWIYKFVCRSSFICLFRFQSIFKSRFYDEFDRFSSFQFDAVPVSFSLSFLSLSLSLTMKLEKFVSKLNKFQTQTSE